MLFSLSLCNVSRWRAIPVPKTKEEAERAKRDIQEKLDKLGGPGKPGKSGASCEHPSFVCVIVRHGQPEQDCKCLCEEEIAKQNKVLHKELVSVVVVVKAIFRACHDGLCIAASKAGASGSATIKREGDSSSDSESSSGSSSDSSGSDSDDDSGTAY